MTYSSRLRSLGMKCLGIKFLVLVVATALLWLGKLQSNDWMLVAMTFMGVNVLQKRVAPGEAA